MSVVKTPDIFDGDPQLESHCISVLQVADLVLADHSLETVTDQVGLSLAEVHEAMAYFYGHPEVMDELRARDEELEAKMANRSDAPRKPQ